MADLLLVLKGSLLELLGGIRHGILLLLLLSVAVDTIVLLRRLLGGIGGASVGLRGGKLLLELGDLLLSLLDVLLGS